MADDLDLQRADDIADKADAIHRRAGRHQRRRHRQKRVAGADRIDDIFGERRNGMDDAAALEGDAAVLALREMIFEQSMCSSARRRAISPTFETRSLTASRASGASMQT